VDFWDFLYPKKCLGCGRFGGYLCEACKVGVWEEEQICPTCCRRSFGGVRHKKCRDADLCGLTCTWSYDGLVRRFITLGKYRFVFDVLRELVPNRLMIEDRADLAEFGKFLLRKPVVVPIPLTGKRVRERGFNQAAVIASQLGSNFGLGVDELLWRKEGILGHQVGKNREARFKAVAGVFQVRRNFTAENILIVDDVWTTGATLREAAKILKSGGAKMVWGFVLGR
jgi:ComF family protein